MKRSFGDWFSDTFILLFRPIITLFLKREITVESEGLRIPRKHKPFILISNHFNTWDSFVVMNIIKKPVRFIATEIAYLDAAKKYSMSILARTIKKRVGKSDFQATKKIFEYLKLGYAIGLYPEGDNTFYGETLDIYSTTGKLLKKAGVDVLLVKQQGGYISQPRWADYFAKKGYVHTEARFLLSTEDLTKLSEEEINDIVRKELYNNDYDFQRTKMMNFNRKNRAEGIERLIYYCNKCGSFVTVFGEGHDIYCSKCGKIGTINEYEFIEGNKHDNLVDWNKEQYAKMNEIVSSEFTFVVTLNEVDTNKLKNKKIGQYRLKYKDQALTLINQKGTYVFELKKIKYPVNTMRHSFSFDYEGITYNLTDIRNQFILYEMCRYINGSYKE